MFSDNLKVNKLNWLFFDLDSYFASVEQQQDTKLQGKPVAVVTDMADSACLVAASYEAKRFGIKTAIRVGEARRLCPELICVPAKHRLYAHYHHLIFNEINKYLHIDHKFSIDEGACRLTGNQTQEEVIISLVKTIKSAIKKNIGDYITCSIGIAPNRYLAKIASSIKKPNGLTIIRPEDIPLKLFALNIKSFPGIGASTFRRLNAFGIDTVKKLYGLDSSKLEAAWGGLGGKKCWFLIRGVDFPLEAVKKHTIGQSRILAEENQSEKTARNIMQALAVKLATRLRIKKLYASRIVIHIKDNANKVFKDSIKISPSNDSLTLSKIALMSWDNIVRTNKIMKIRKIAISLPDIAEESKQLSFDNLDKINQRREISVVIDKLNKHYGSNIISFGPIDFKQKDNDPIAFSYIPEN